MRPAVRVVFAPIARRGRPRGDEALDAPTQGDSCGRTIRLDPRLPNVGRTLLHELLHVWHPGWTEDQVMAAEEYKWTHMTWRKKAALYRMLGNAKLEGEA
jgi:hypothetical protein